MNIDDLIGKVFIADNGDPFGDIRKLDNSMPADLDIGDAIPLAEDTSGNLFLLRDESICFWDHETGEIHELASSFEVFRNGCANKHEADLNADAVESAWIDPEFAEEQGVDAPKNGRIKKP